ncbi:MAG TPA: putative toxin-antitoxin system toxin component, PIN family [Verrucomicrobiae bacterium]|nr:putative toxin-antitoxin system toxin component, PIN family [Verrucomicrobiae bacterium]
MIRAVFDCSAVISGVGWRNESYQCLVLVARRRVRGFVTDWICEEYRRVAQGMEAEKLFARSPWPVLDWFISACRAVEPDALGKQRSRDPSDDPYLACALAAKAEFVISPDQDLLVLGKPFGIEVLTPRAFLNQLYAARK